MNIVRIIYSISNLSTLVKNAALTVIPNLCINFTQWFIVVIVPVDGLVSIQTTRERDRWVIQDIENACIPNIGEFAVLDAAVGSGGT